MLSVIQDPRRMSERGHRLVGELSHRLTAGANPKGAHGSQSSLQWSHAYRVKRATAKQVPYRRFWSMMGSFSDN